MTDETKEVFAAPWEATERGTVITANDGDRICTVVNPANANRIARLPELYDALMKTVYYKCFECMGGLRHNIDMTREELVKNGCPKQNKGNVCIYVKHIELLREVRDG